MSRILPPLKHDRFQLSFRDPLSSPLQTTHGQGSCPDALSGASTPSFLLCLLGAELSTTYHPTWKPFLLPVVVDSTFWLSCAQLPWEPVSPPLTFPTTPYFARKPLSAPASIFFKGKNPLTTLYPPPGANELIEHVSLHVFGPTAPPLFDTFLICLTKSSFYGWTEIWPGRWSSPILVPGAKFVSPSCPRRLISPSKTPLILAVYNCSFANNPPSFFFWGIAVPHYFFTEGMLKP